MRSHAEITRVLPKRQKLMGLKNKSGKLATDESVLIDLKLKPGVAVMMLGAQEEAIEAASTHHAEGDAALIDDLQMTEELFEELEPHKDPVVLVRLACQNAQEKSTKIS
jgi:hypothetical protein